MNSIEATIRDALQAGGVLQPGVMDMPRFRAAAKAAMPQIPQDFDDAAMLVLMHQTRTAKEACIPRLRFYSHRWLGERGRASALPDRLKRSAERMYPRAVPLVGIIVWSKFGGKYAEQALGRAMSNKVEELFADGDTDPLIVRPEMMRANFREREGLEIPLPKDIPMEWRP